MQDLSGVLFSQMIYSLMKWVQHTEQRKEKLKLASILLCENPFGIDPTVVSIILIFGSIHPPLVLKPKAK